jgi:hypothetical protein
MHHTGQYALPLWIFSYKEEGALVIDELLGIYIGYVVV